ncbi:MAG: hypothetical protein ACK5OS_02605 [Chryseotalea sp.]|jgi:membrane protein involved in colicin uptake
MKYNKKQLAELAQGVFATSHLDKVYALENGTFYNEEQKAKLSEETQYQLIEFKKDQEEETAAPADLTDEQKAELEAKALAEAEAKKAEAAKKKAAAEAKKKEQ